MSIDEGRGIGSDPTKPMTPEPLRTRKICAWDPGSVTRFRHGAFLPTEVEGSFFLKADGLWLLLLIIFCAGVLCV